jgi:hypothetical protein
LIPTGEGSGLQTRIATTESGLLCNSDEKLSAFVELESAIRPRYGSLPSDATALLTGKI